jgi:hypothetical protein
MAIVTGPLPKTALSKNSHRRHSTATTKPKKDARFQVIFILVHRRSLFALKKKAGKKPGEATCFRFL